MTAAGYVNMSIKPEAKARLQQLARELSAELGRNVSMSEALDMALAAIHAHELDVAEMQV